jgi:hypothetical protein
VQDPARQTLSRSQQARWFGARRTGRCLQEKGRPLAGRPTVEIRLMALEQSSFCEKPQLQLQADAG